MQARPPSYIEYAVSMPQVFPTLRTVPAVTHGPRHDARRSARSASLYSPACVRKTGSAPPPPDHLYCFSRSSGSFTLESSLGLPAACPVPGTPGFACPPAVFCSVFFFAAGSLRWRIPGRPPFVDLFPFSCCVVCFLYLLVFCSECLKDQRILVRNGPMNEPAHSGL